jgi:hypothetical protein
MADDRLIGRTEIEHAIVEKVETGGAAVVLQGPPGMGKTTIIGRVVTELARKGYDTILIRGRTAAPLILKEISLKAKAEGVKEAQEIFEADIPLKEKYDQFLENFLSYKKVLLILDDFEENQTRGGKILRQDLREFLGLLLDSLKGKDLAVSVLAASQYRAAGFDPLKVPGLSPGAFAEFLEGADALKRSDGETRQAILDDIGGSPMALRLLDRIASKEFGSQRQPISWPKLKESIPGLKRRILQEKRDEEALIRILLNKLLKNLDEKQIRLLQAISIYDLPVGSAAIEGLDGEAADEDRTALSKLSLLEYSKDLDRYDIHPFTAAYVLDKMEKKQKKEWHGRAGQFMANLKDEEGKKSIDDYLAARRHYLLAGQGERAAEIALELGAYLTGIGFPEFSFQLLIEVAGKKLSEPNRAGVHYQIGQICLKREDYPAALKYLLTAFLLFVKLQSQYAGPVKKAIVGLREKMDSGAFEEILREFDIPADEFDPEVVEQQEFLDFLDRLTVDVVHFFEKSSAEKERIVDLLTGMVKEPAYDTPDLQKFKIYFQMLLNYIHRDDIEKYRQALSPELKSLFDRILHDSRQ